MRRFLFVVPPLAGHTNPTVGVARALRERGHEVAWSAYRSAVGHLLPGDATILELDPDAESSARAGVPGLVEELAARRRKARGAGAFKLLWEEFLVPLARAMVPGVERAVDVYRPDVVIVDHETLGGALVARRRALPWATLATTSAGIIDPLAGLPRVAAWLEGLLADLQREVGVDAVPQPGRSPQMVIVFSTPALIGSQHRFENHVHFVGPSLGARPPGSDFPWSQLTAARRVLVSLGTVNADAGARFFAEAAAGLGGAPYQVVLVAPEGMVPEPPANFIVRSHVPQMELLRHVHAVVSHAGHNTVAETLAHGLPLVVAPIKDDQPIVAQQVVDAGCGLRVKFGRVRGPALRAAVDRVLDEPAFREAAERIRVSFDAAGGAKRAAELLEGLAP